MENLKRIKWKWLYYCDDAQYKSIHSLLPAYRIPEQELRSAINLFQNEPFKFKIVSAVLHPHFAEAINISKPCPFPGHKLCFEPEEAEIMEIKIELFSLIDVIYGFSNSRPRPKVVTLSD